MTINLNKILVHYVFYYNVGLVINEIIRTQFIIKYYELINIEARYDKITLGRVT